MTSMTPERWQRMKGVLYEALELPTEKRAEFLDRVCSGEDSFRQEVDSMLSSDDQACSSLLQSSRPRVPLSPGTRLGHYEVQSLLGAGGMGEVYRGHDPRLGRDVAVKVLPHLFSEDPERLRRFEQEGRAAAALNHPNILAIYDVGTTEEGIPYVVSELLEGETLRQCLKRGPLPVRKAVDLALQMASGLAAAHDKGIIHRDLKPENLFLTKGGHLKILDFGLAKLVRSPVSHEARTLTEGTEAGVVMGTVGYMPPEQVRGFAVDQRSDIFAAGAIMYEMLSGKRAFRGETHADTIDAILNQDPPALSATNPAVPPAFERIVRRCLEKNPDERFHSVRDVAFAIEALTDLPSATQHPALVRDSRWLRWAKWVGASALVLAAVWIGLYLIWYSRQGRHLAERDTIFLGGFDNSTGDGVFDGTLRQGLSFELEQSPSLKIVSEEQIHQTLRMMGQKTDAHLTPEITREVCQRTNSAAALNGSIALIGTRYDLILRAVDCASGDLLASTKAQAKDKSGVLDALSKVASEMRSKLGESLSTVQKYNTPLIQVTTPSLEALQSYTLGAKTQTQTGDFAASLPWFQRAVELDPNFAMAYWAMGDAYSALGETTSQAANTRKAFELRAGVSERERLVIEGDYYYFVTGDIIKARRSFELFAKLYPNSDYAHNMLATFCNMSGQHDAALNEHQEALRLSPRRSILHRYVIFTNLLLDRVADAEAAAKEAHATGLDSDLTAVLYGIAFYRNDSGEMARQAARAEGRPGMEDLLLALEADTAAFVGHLGEAREFSHRAADSGERAGEKETAAVYSAVSALRDALFGNAHKARQQAITAKGHSTGRDLDYGVALAFAYAGDTSRAQALTDDLGRRFPEDTIVKFNYLPTLRAKLALNRSTPQQALKVLGISAPYELGLPTSSFYNWPNLYPVYVRGEAYLAAHRGGEAAAEFQKILDHRGIVLNEPIGALAHLQLSRAYAMSGDTAKARASYQNFLALWNDADPEIPILKQAQAEYAKLP